MMNRRMGAALVALTVLGTTELAPAMDKAECLRSYESAQRNRKASQFRAARRDVLSCLDPACPELLRADCAGWLDAIEQSTPTVVFEVRAGKREVTDARVSVDGQLVADAARGVAVPLDPGTRKLRVEHDAYPAVELEVVIREGDKNRRLVLELAAGDSTPPPASTERGIPSESLVLASVAAVGLVSFGYFGLKGLAGRSDLDECKGRCSSDAVDDVRADFLRADISLAVAALALGGAAYFYFGATPATEAPTARVGFGASAQPGRVSAFARARF